MQVFDLLDIDKDGSVVMEEGIAWELALNPNRTKEAARADWMQRMKVHSRVMAPVVPPPPWCSCGSGVRHKSGWASGARGVAAVLRWASGQGRGPDLRGGRCAASAEGTAQGQARPDEACQGQADAEADAAGDSADCRGGGRSSQV